MCAEVCGEKLDIHSGGSDLKFPHHDDEIAQVKSFSPFESLFRSNVQLTSTSVIAVRGSLRESHVGQLLPPSWNTPDSWAQDEQVTQG